MWLLRLPPQLALLPREAFELPPRVFVARALFLGGLLLLFVQLVLPPRQPDGGYVRPPMTDQTFVPQVY